MTQRQELRRQWRAENKKREQQGKSPMKWQEWDHAIDFKRLEDVDPELAASRDALRGEA